MTDHSLRSVTVRRTGAGRMVAVNQHGVELPLGTDRNLFSPVELLLAGLAGCSGLDVEALTSRRAEPEEFEMDATADKVRDDSGNHLANIEVTFRVRFPAGEGGDAAREMLPDMVARSHDRLCTVSRTVERPSPVTTRVAPADE